jgi:hypothetical protein
MDIIDIKIKDQFDQIHDAKAQLKKNLVEHENEPLKLSQRIEHIIVDNEVILPLQNCYLKVNKTKKFIALLKNNSKLMKLNAKMIKQKLIKH